MYKFLNSLSTARLAALAESYQLDTSSREVMIEELIDLYRSNGINVSHLKANNPDLMAAA